LGFTLRYAHEVTSPVEYFSAIPKMTLPEEMIEVAERLIEMKSGEFDPAYLEDRYRTVLVEKLSAMQTDLPPTKEVGPPARQNVIDLMAALKRSISAERPTDSARGDKKQGPRAAAALVRPAPRKRSRSRSS
jgi:non-homologous end joining protein Ku